MAGRFSRLFESSRGRSAKDYARFEAERYAREYANEKAENDLAKANIIRELGRENSELTAQINDLKQEAAILRDLIRRKEDEVRELHIAVEEKEYDNMNINEMAENNIKQLDIMNKQLAEQLNEQITMQLTDMADKLESRINELETKLDAQAEIVSAAAKTSGIDGNQIINVVSENVHNESVKCYRNMQSLVEEMDEKLTAIEAKKVSITGTTALVVITMLVSLGNLALIVLRILGYI